MDKLNVNIMYQFNTVTDGSPYIRLHSLSAS